MEHSPYKGTIALLTLLLILGFALVAGAAPRDELWPRWQDHDPRGTIQIDHSPMRGSGKHKATLDSVKDYYGKILQGSKDLKTSACCSIESFPPTHRAILAEIDSEILDRFYGCGSTIPPASFAAR